MKQVSFTILILCLTVLFPLQLTAQTRYQIEDFSSYFHAIVEVDNDADNDSQTGRIIVYDTKSKKQLLQVESERIYLDLQDGKVKANVKELPYGEQSILIYEDFNFDGFKDLAIQDGFNSCYGGPSYQIYLRDGKGFSHSAGFTDLAQSYCGMFNVDHEEKKIYTMTKSGCCWHQFSEFVVENNHPVAVKIVEEGSSYSISYVTEVSISTREGGKMKTVNEKYMGEINEDDLLFYFELEKNGKKVYLFKYNNELNYVFTNENDKIEFDYQVMCKNPKYEFITTKGKRYLKFINPGAEYQVYLKILPQGKEYGTNVITNGKTYTNKANLESVKGSLKKVSDFLNN